MHHHNGAPTTMSDDAPSALLGMADNDVSLLQCYTDGNFDRRKYFRKRMRENDNDFDEIAELLNDDGWGKNDPPTRKDKKKRMRRIILARCTDDGVLEEIPPTDSMWYNLYIACPQVNDTRFHQKFRRRFRLPYNSFLEFVEDAREGNWFPRWMGKDATGKDASPIELLILGAFRYLGRGFTFDDCEEATAISEEVHRVFFHRFIDVGSKILFDKYVITPTTPEEIEEHMHEFEMAGMPGVPASSDATSIIHENCEWRLRRLHKGGKSKHPTRTFNTEVNHRRRIIGTTTGHPGSWNDKTLVLFDTFIRDIKSGHILSDYTFELLEQRGEEVVAVKYKGVWIVVDNGYHAWSITVPPFSNTDNRKEIRWSEWLESMRKDVECTFGILKGRWRILKSGIRLHSVESVDKIWLTCCALHNMLLEVDGLDEPWDGVCQPTSQWEGELGNLESDDVPMAMRCLMSPADIRAYDTSSLGTEVTARRDEERDEEEEEENGTEQDDGDEELNEDAEEEVRIVRKLSLKYFRSKLVEHFDIKFRRGEVVWPSRRGKTPSVYFDD